MKKIKIDVWHNIMWSKYKAGVFSRLNANAEHFGVLPTFYQIADTTAERVGLSSVDTSVHKYPYTKLFDGGYNNIPLLPLYGTMVKLVLTTSADIVLLAGYDRPEYWLQALTLKLRSKKFAVFCDSTIYDNPQTFIKGLLKRIFFKMAAGVFCYGNRARAYILHYGGSPDKIFYRCQAAWLPDTYDASTIPDRRVRARRTADPIRYLYVGRLSPEKRIDTLIRAFSSLPQAPRLVIVGAGPQQDALRALAQELGVADRVEFKGGLSGDPLWHEYLSASCLVLPSFREPWGLVANEALSHGCPVVVSDRCGCVPELVAEGRSGFAFPCDDVAALADRLMKVPEVFPDTDAVARACLAQIAPFTPDAAANAILAGATELVSRGTRDGHSALTTARQSAGA